jgi:hypothetical protein
MQFTPTAAPKGKHVYLQIDDVHDYAHVTLNGKEVGARSFQPYRWDVTGALKPGANDLKIEVYANVNQTPAAAPPAATATSAATATGAVAPAVGARRRQAATASTAGVSPVVAVSASRAATAPVVTSGLLGSVKLVAY